MRLVPLGAFDPATGGRLQLRLGARLTIGSAHVRIHDVPGVGRAATLALQIDADADARNRGHGIAALLALSARLRLPILSGEAAVRLGVWPADQALSDDGRRLWASSRLAAAGDVRDGILWPAGGTGG